MTAGSAALEARSVGVSYRSGAPVLADVSLDLREGELLAVLGPNGAGKSTLVRVLAGILRPTTGEVRLGGRPIVELSRREVATRLAVVAQQTEVALGFRVREAVAMGRAPRQGAFLVESATDAAAVDEALRRCGLEALADRPVDELSGGEQRLVAIARALAQEAPVWILDEPTAHLDVRHALDVHELVREEIERRKIACLAVLHDLNAASQYADRVALLAKGRLAAIGTIEDVMTYRRLGEVFDAELYVGVNEIDRTRYFVPMRRRGSPLRRERETDTGRREGAKDERVSREGGFRSVRRRGGD